MKGEPATIGSRWRFKRSDCAAFVVTDVYLDERRVHWVTGYHEDKWGRHVPFGYRVAHLQASADRLIRDASAHAARSLRKGRR